MLAHKRVQQHVGLLGMTAAYPDQSKKKVQQIEEDDRLDQAIQPNQVLGGDVRKTRANGQSSLHLYQLTQHTTLMITPCLGVRVAAYR